MMFCCCSDPCKITSVATFANLDDFTQIGTVTIASGAAVLESGEGLVTVAEPTNYYDPVILTVTAETADSSGTLRLAVARLDADNYLFGEYAFSGTTGALRLGIRSAASEDWLTDAVEVEDTTDLGDSTTFSLCWVPGPVQTGGSFLIDDIYPLNAEVSVPGDWDDPDLTLDADGTYATCDFNSGPGTGGVCQITWRAFPIALPPGSTIDNLSVGIMCRLKALTGFGPINLTTLTISKADGTAGSNLGASQAVPSPISPGEIGASEDMATWGSDLTWENFNTGGLSVTAEFTQGPSAGAFLEIDYCVVSIDFTTPDRQPGRLTFSRGNVTAMTVDCVREYSAEAPGEGKKAMVLSGAGEWHVSALTYQYHQSGDKPSCPTCSDAAGGVCSDIGEAQTCSPCCPTVAFQYLVDFGVGGWEADAPCDNECDFFTGEVEVTWGDLFPQDDCEWFVEFRSTDCGSNNSLWGLVTLALIHDDETDECYWRVFAWITAVFDGEPADFYPYNWAQWESARFAAEEECTMPIELTKVGEAKYTGGVCPTGTMPGTITIEDV